MKKNSGFTLVEVLLTLGVIGVIAAIAMPIFYNTFISSKVPTSLRKVIATLETANEHILAEGESNDLSRVASTDANYINQLKKYVIGSEISGTKTIQSISYADKTIYNLKGDDSLGASKELLHDLGLYDTTTEVTEKDNETGTETKYNGLTTSTGAYRGPYTAILYDVNGVNNDPNLYGKDLFILIVDKGGSVIPYGSQKLKDIYTSKIGDTNSTIATWNVDTTGCHEDDTKDAKTCAGSIADNNWKIIYDYNAIK